MRRIANDFLKYSTLMKISVAVYSTGTSKNCQHTQKDFMERQTGMTSHLVYGSLLRA